MKEELNQQVPQQNGHEEDELNLMDLLRIALANWYWFAISVAACICIAFVFLKSTPKEYHRSASVLIKDEKRTGQLASETSAFSDLGGFMGMKSSVDNEVLVFKSKRLMEDVVRRLHLDVDYKTRTFLLENDVYTTSPVVARFPEAGDASEVSFTVRPLSGDGIWLSVFVAV